VDMAEENLTNPDRVSVVCSLLISEYYHRTWSNISIRHVSYHCQNILLHVHLMFSNFSFKNWGMHHFLGHMVVGFIKYGTVIHNNTWYSAFVQNCH
jgi:hypothetical protein